MAVAGDLVERWKGRARRYSVELLSILGNVASIMALAIAFFTGATATVFSIYIVAVASLLAAMLVWRELHYARKATYAEILAHLHHVVHDIRDRIDDVPAPSKAGFKQQVENVIDALALAFSIVTRTNCRACIKVLVLHPGAGGFDSLDARQRTRHLLVRTFIRDTVNTVPQAEESADFLDGNTDLCVLFTDPHKRWFCENDLPRLFKSGGYRNSHFPPGAFTDWPLPYRSAAIWPIRKMGETSSYHPNQEVLGFLCIDSKTENVFVPRFDFEVGALVADALYIFMKSQFQVAPSTSGVSHGG